MNNTFGSLMAQGSLDGDGAPQMSLAGDDLSSDLYGDLMGDAEMLGVDIVGFNPMNLARKIASGASAAMNMHELQFLRQLFQKRKQLMGAIQGHGGHVRTSPPLVNAIPGVNAISKGRGPLGVQWIDGALAGSGGTAAQFDLTHKTATCQMVPQRPFKIDTLFVSQFFVPGLSIDVADAFPVVLTAMQVGTFNVLASAGAVAVETFASAVLNNRIEVPAAQPGVILQMSFACPNTFTDGSKLLSVGSYGGEVF